MTLCSYCRSRPRVPGSSYCINPQCAIKKRELNQRNKPHKAAKQREARRVRREAELKEAERIYQHAEYMKRKARKVLREQDEAHRIAPVVTVTKWNVRTGEIEVVNL